MQIAYKLHWEKKITDNRNIPFSFSAGRVTSDTCPTCNSQLCGSEEKIE